jgi:hypothetical protein
MIPLLFVLITGISSDSSLAKDFGHSCKLEELLRMIVRRLASCRFQVCLLEQRAAPDDVPAAPSAVELKEAVHLGLLRRH